MTEYCEYCGQTLAGGTRKQRDKHIAECRGRFYLRKARRKAALQKEVLK